MAVCTVSDEVSDKVSDEVSDEVSEAREHHLGIIALTGFAQSDLAHMLTIGCAIIHRLIMV